MFRKSIKKKVVAITIAVSLISQIIPALAQDDNYGLPLRDRASARDQMPRVDFDISLINLPYYDEAIEVFNEAGYRDIPGEVKVSADFDDTVLYNRDEEQEEKVFEEFMDNMEGPFLILPEGSDAEFFFDVPQSGLYQIRVDYFTLEGRGNQISRRVLVNGESQFQEALTLNFPRLYMPDGEPRVASNGDHIRPRQIEIYTYDEYLLEDARGFYSEPLRFKFEEGVNSLRLNFVSEPIAIKGIHLVSPSEILPYEEVYKYYISNGYEPVDDVYIKQQSENVFRVSDPILRSQSHPDPLVQPSADGDFILNIFGDSRWTRGNQEATWKIDVPESGLYQLAFKTGQWFNNGNPSHRQISINGQVPFREFLNYGFEFSRDWQMVVLSDEDKQPYLVYLEEGENTISLKVKMGYMGPLANHMTEFSIRMSSLIREITRVTGFDPDPNFEYELDRQIPDIVERLEDFSRDIQVQMDYLEEVSGMRPSEYYGMRRIRRTLDEMADNPDRITTRFAELQRAHGDFGNWVESLQVNPVAFDFFCITSPGHRLPRARARFYEKFISGIRMFIKSFVKDYDNIGNIEDDDADVIITDTIEVWVSIGREWAESLRDIVDNDFTPKTGVKVIMNTFPAGQLAAAAAGAAGGGGGGQATSAVNVLLLAINSGQAPDVGVGVDHRSPVEFAIRGATADLTQFEDFEEVSGWFIENAFIPYTYMGGVYAIPCQQDFSVLYYRKDILHDLGIGIPQTWDDLYSILPILDNNSMNFFMPPIFDPFLFQSGGDFYTDDGFLSALDTAFAFSGFRDFTAMYTSYNIPRAANFYNRFRSGEMPLGVGGYNEYVQFNIAAPEIQGLWGMAPFLGTRREDGTIDRTTGAMINNTNIILDQSENQEVAWEFIKWWMSEEIQTQFGRQIEAIVGMGARWNSANVEAFRNLPWREDEIEVITRQWDEFKVEPVVLGSYATARYLGFAWNNVVIGGANPRDALEEAVRNINREMRMKQEEYGVFPEN